MLDGTGAQWPEGEAVRAGRNRGQIMGFLIRSAFWIGLVLLIIPVGGNDGEESAREVGLLEAAGAAAAAFSDLRGMCERQPQVCETAGAALDTIAARARESLRLAHEAFSENDATETVAVEADGQDVEAALVTGSVPSARPELRP
jgi:hypothetical protein